jgi:hypothetical protein
MLNTIDVDIGNMDYPALSALSALRERVDQKVREMREMGGQLCVRSSQRKPQPSG